MGDGSLWRLIFRASEAAILGAILGNRSTRIRRQLKLLVCVFVRCLPTFTGEMALAASAAMQGAKVASFNSALAGDRLTLSIQGPSKRTAPLKTVAAGTVRGTQRGGTRVITVGLDNKEGRIRTDNSVVPRKVQLLARVEELRLLSKAEQAGLLSLLDRLGFSLGKIEKLGLLSKAESLGVFSLLADEGTPGKLGATGALFFAAAPAIVYLSPDETVGLVGAVLCGAAATALFAGSTAISALQK
eukprot:jgi/Mesvir1/17127/Mv07559-RA.1